MNKKILIGSLVAILVLGSGALVAAKNTKKDDTSNLSAVTSANMSPADKVVTENKVVEEVAVSTAQTTAPDVAAKDSEAAATGDVMATHGNYVTLAEYNANKAKYADTKLVYFFHAPWCPTCQGIEKEINADISRIPKGVTFIKTDYDTNVELKKQYGVTVQTTFVQVDAQGNKVAKWAPSNLAAAVAGVL